MDPSDKTNIESKEETPKLAIEKSPKDEVDFLDDCLPTTDRLNLTADEKDELEDLDEATIEAEYEKFIKSTDQNEQMKALLQNFQNILNFEETKTGNESKNPLFDMNFDNFSNEKGFGEMTDAMLGTFLQKDMIYEPLHEAKKKLEELLQKHPNDESSKKKMVEDKAKYDLICELIALYDKPDFDSPTNKEIITAKFEELHDMGGLPSELMQEGMKGMPKLDDLENMEEKCNIF